MSFQLSKYELTKLAAGDVQTFENSLATIGRSFLGAKAPGLFKHEIGFQVLDQDKDNTKAVGVFGFKVGKRIVYVPVFYRDGVIKGTEQLRDPKNKQTVPLSDNYVNKFLMESGDEPPEARRRSDTRDTAQPSLWQLKFPPTKYAADFATIKKDVGRAIGKLNVPEPTFPDLLKVAEAHPEVLEYIGEYASKYPWFAKAIDKFYGHEKLAAALKKAEQAEARKPLELFKPADKDLFTFPAKQAGEVTSMSLTITRRRGDLKDVKPPKGMLFDSDEWEKLRDQEDIYKDDRGPKDKSEVTWVGGVDIGSDIFRNPLNNGIYQVLVEGHELAECIVLTHLTGWGPARDRVFVMRKSDKKWTLTHQNAVWVTGEADHDAFAKWVDDLQQVKDEVEGVPNGSFVAIAKVNENPNFGAGFVATVPFNKSEDGCVHALGYVGSKKPFWAAANDVEHVDRPDYQHGRVPLRKDDSEKRVEVFDEASKPILHGNELYLPQGCHLLKIDDAYGKRLQLGDGTDPERYLFARRHKMGDKAVTLKKDAHAWFVNQTKLAGVNAVKFELIARRGIDAQLVEELVKVAKANGRVEFMVKYADQYSRNLADDAPNAPTMPFDQIAAPASFADDVVPTETGSVVSIPIQDMLMRAGAQDRYRPYPMTYGIQGDVPGIGNGSEPPPPSKDEDKGYSDRDVLGSVATAAASGRRELFDTAFLAALVKHKRIGTLLQETKTRLSKAVSDLGDLLAHMHWNIDAWTEQFGESEVGPLEDQMQSQFEGLGELVLLLQEKIVGNTPDAGIIPELRPPSGGDSEK